MPKHATTVEMGGMRINKFGQKDAITKMINDHVLLANEHGQDIVVYWSVSSDPDPRVILSSHHDLAVREFVCECKESQ